MVIDSHAHVWDLDARDQPWIPAGSPLRRTFGLEDLAALVERTPIERVVLVQVINDAEETADLLAAADHPIVAGVVGWSDLSDDGFRDAVVSLGANKSLVGIRHQALAEADPARWLLSARVDAALAVLEREGLAFDLIVRPEHLAAATAAARAHPSLRVVLDHLGKPPISSGEFEPWAGAVRTLAAEPNVRCKLSGIQTVAAASSTYADVARYLDVVLAAFGPARLMFGSDWPVSSAASSYRGVWNLVDRFCADLSPSERSAIFGDAAAETYRLDRHTSVKQ